MVSWLDQPPLDPSSEQARQWVRDELARGSYQTEPSLFQRFVEWLLSHLQPGSGSGVSPWVAILVVLVVIGLAVLVVLFVRREPAPDRGERVGGAVDDEGLTARDYRRRADAAAAQGDWDTVVVDRYRAVAAAAVERALLTELPGRTADEVAIALGPIFPVHRDALGTAAAVFDEVRYGHLHASRSQADALAALDQTLASTKPRLEPVPSR